MSRTQPLLLILDNAESFLQYTNHTHIKEIEDILSDIAATPNVTLILTKRGVELPVVVKWDELEELNVLSLNDARQVFLSIATNSSNVSPNLALLDSLLEALDCVPLAVKLLAQVAQSGKERVEQLHKRWTSRRTDLLKLRGRPNHRETCISTSIEVSLHSQLMEEDIYAKRLLGIISYLPDGILLTKLEDLSAEWDSNVHESAHTLKQLSLAHESSSHDFLTTLSPIREHISRHHDITEADLKLIRHWHLTLSNRGYCNPGDTEFLSTQADLAINQNNISAVLRRHIDNDLLDQEVLRAVFHFSWFLYWRAPNGDLLHLVLSSQHANKLKSTFRGQFLLLLGIIFRMQHDPDKAKAILAKSRTELEVAGDANGVAQCIQNIGEVLGLQNDHINARLCFVEARTQFQTIGNGICAAQCTRSLGDIFRLQRDYSNAAPTLKEARLELEAAGDRLGAAQCAKSLGDILSAQTDYDSAKTMLTEAQLEFVALGSRLGAAHCALSLSNILHMQNEYDSAIAMLKEARVELIAMGDRFGAAQCDQCIGHALRAQGDYDSATTVLKKARLDFEAIGNRHGAARCALSLGNILREQNEYDSAIAMLKEARLELMATGDRLGAAQCARSLGNILRAQNDNDNATVVLARLEFMEIGDRHGAAQCA
jgi:tetratricopeptide (TPR) repeat protein